MSDQELYSGLIRLHILYKAAKQPVNGNLIRSELDSKGYYISGSSLYPILARLEKQGYLMMDDDTDNKTSSKMYRSTEKGQQKFQESKLIIKKLFGELFE